jgi:hypothetical protein
MCRCQPIEPIADVSFQDRKRTCDFGRFEAMPVACEVRFCAKISIPLKTAKPNWKIRRKEAPEGQVKSSISLLGLAPIFRLWRCPRASRHPLAPWVHPR